MPKITIPVSKEVQDVINPALLSLNARRNEAHKLLEIVYKEEEEVWKIIKEAHPEAHQENRSATYNIKAGVVILWKMSSEEISSALDKFSTKVTP